MPRLRTSGPRDEVQGMPSYLARTATNSFGRSAHRGVKGRLRVSVDKAVSPVLVVLRSQPPLDAVPEAYHNPAAIWLGSLHLPRSCRHGPGGHRRGRFAGARSSVAVVVVIVRRLHQLRWLSISRGWTLGLRAGPSGQCGARDVPVND